jgi:NitT/TauT family transport system substrate-binding protein
LIDWQVTRCAEEGEMRRSVVRLTTILAGLAMLTACGGGGSGTATSSAAPLTRVSLTVGVVGVIDVAPLYLGIKKGFFDKQELTITPKVLNTGATVVAGVVAGDLPFGFTNNTSVVIAASQRFPLRIVAAGNQAAAGDYCAVLVRRDSPIASARDLAGKKIAVNGLKNVGSLTVNAALQASGVDISGIQYVEVPFPQMGAALDQGLIDAAWAVEPFVTVMKSANDRIVLRPMTLIAKNFPVASYVTNTQYLQQNAGVVSRFRTAINQSLTYAQGHPDEARAVLADYIKLAPGLADQVVLPAWGTDPQASLIGKTADLAQSYGYTSRKPDLKQLIAVS